MIDTIQTRLKEDEKRFNNKLKDSDSEDSFEGEFFG